MPLLKAARAAAAAPAARRYQQGKMGYILLWLIGVPLPVLFIIYLLRGCS